MDRAWGEDPSKAEETHIGRHEIVREIFYVFLLNVIDGKRRSPSLNPSANRGDS
jgi:hypothetical protein